LEKLFNLIYYLILTLTLTLSPQLSPNPIRKPNIKYARMNIAQCSSFRNIIFFRLNTYFWKFYLEAEKKLVTWLPRLEHCRCSLRAMRRTQL